MNIFHLSRRAFIAAALAATAMSGPVAAQDYPNKPITILVPFGAGGATDVTTRLIADIVGEKLGQRVIVENQPGAGGGLMAANLAQAEPDGYTLGALTASPILVRPHTVEDSGYDSTKDFTFISRTVLAPQPIAVASDSPWNTYQDMIAWAKENPGKLRYTAVAQLGGAHVVIAKAFQEEGVEAVHIPFNNGPEATTAFRGDNLEMIAQSDYAALLDAGEIKILAETGPERLPVAPEAPTFRELGYNVSPAIFYGIGGPAGLPTEIVERWDSLIKEATESEEFRALLARLKMIPGYLPSEEFRKAAMTDYELIGKAVDEMKQ